jgi:DNA-binding YbaB/EbfC family protein
MSFDPKKLQEMVAQAQQQAAQLQTEMANTTVEASAGGGSVTVKMNGQKRLIGIKIEKEVVNPDDVEMLQDLIIAAINEASRKAEEAMQSSVGGMMGKMNLPGLF